MPRRRQQNLLIGARSFGRSTAILDASFRVKRYSASVYGGPKLASVEVRGDESTMLSLRTLLRCPVEIFDDEADVVWWGCVYRATAYIGNVSLSWSLDELANRVAVVYTATVPGASGSRKITTDWAEQALSIVDYGTKERLVTLSDGDSVYAEGLRDQMLARLGQPVRGLELTNSEPGIARGELELRGWFDTLGWRYYAQAAGLASYARSGGKAEALPLSPGAVGQSFQINGTVGWDARAAAVRMKAESAPTDNYTIALRSDSAGAPGAVLATTTLPASGLSGSATWSGVTFTTPVTLAPATTYWVVVQRSQASDNGTRITVDIDESAGYVGGAYRVYNGSSWAARSPNASLMFQVQGEQETTAQVAPLVTATGQFITATTVVEAAGITTNQYRAGERTGLQELTDLLNLGTADGRRLLARVDLQRRLIIEPEPAAPGVFGKTSYLTRRNDIIDANGVRVTSASCPYGLWVRPQALMDQLAQVEPVFIDEAEYDVATDRLRFIARDQRDPRQLARVKDR